MRTATVMGIVLIGLGLLSLAYFASPIGFLVRETSQQEMNLIPPIFGAIALVGGIALLVVIRPKANKSEL